MGICLHAGQESAWEAEAVLFGEGRFFASEGGVDNGSYESDGFLDLLFASYYIYYLGGGFGFIGRSARFRAGL